jgi:circadian clock protein KaiC
VEGSPGTGKTTLALQYLLAGADQGEKSLYVTLSETKDELKSVADSHGFSLEKISIFEMTPPASLLPDEQYTIFHPSDVEFSETMKAVIQQLDAVQPSRVVFDSLSEMRLLARDALRYRRQILALKQYFSGRNCTVLLLDDRTGEGSDQLQSIVHGVLNLEQVPKEYGSERRRLRVSKLRSVRFTGGYHDFTIETGGLSVFPRLISAESRQSFDGTLKSSGLAEVDEMLRGGLHAGTSTLIMGPAGTGKSVLAMQYAAAEAQRGEKSCIFTFDETPQVLLMRGKGLGIDLAPHVSKGLIHLQQVDPAELSPGEFAHRVCRSVVDDGAKLVVIDSLNGYLNAMPEEQFLVAQLHELLTFLSQHGVLTLLISAQQGVLGSYMEAPIDVTYLADSVILLRYFEDQGSVRQAISVVKKRSGNHERTIREFVLKPGKIHVGQPLREFHGILTGVPSFNGIHRSGQDNRSAGD